MPPGDIATEVKKLLEREGTGGWLRTAKCANLYSGEDMTRKRRFYRWRVKVAKKTVNGFKTLNLPNNVSYIGFECANPRTITSETFEIAEVILNRGQQIIGGTTSEFELTIRNRLNSSTTVEEVRIESEGKLISCRKMEDHIDAGRSKRITVSATDLQLDEIWKSGGEITFRIFHTHNEESIRINTNPLSEVHELPYKLYEIK